METHINKEIIQDLINHQTADSITIYLSTHRYGEETLKNEDRIKLKNIIKQIRNEYEQAAYKEKDINEYLEPLYEMLENKTLWRNVSDGLAIFLNKKMFKYYLLPVSFPDIYYTGSEFYIAPILQSLTENREFYVLTLALHGVNLYKGDRFGIEPINTDAFLPKNIEEAVGFDYKDKVLQFRAGQSGSGNTIYHGHGKGDEAKKEEVQKFIQYIDDGLREVIPGDDNRPLILACVDYLFGYFKDFSCFKTLYPKHIKESPQNEKPAHLHQKAWKLMQEAIDKEKHKKIEEYHESVKKSFMIDHILPGATQGRIKTLFLNNRQFEWGVFEPEQNRVKETHPEPKNGDICLKNQAAIYTFKEGGDIIVMPPDQLPAKNKPANAVFWY